MRPSFAVEESVRTLGLNIKSARLRRRLPQSAVAERAGISMNTLSKIENGDCGVSIGNIAAVLQAIGLGSPLSDVAAASADEAGLMLEEKRLPRRIRSRKTEKQQI
jgi:transcriptional regulator with XRE-family HTH domain